jgi:xanthine dehydrogenase YagR molybdenum-binding subunit
VAIAHDVVERSSTVREFAEQTAVATRMMYGAPNRRTTHRLVRLDLPSSCLMRAAGRCPGMHVLASASDELAAELGLDPIELPIRNEPRSVSKSLAVSRVDISSRACAKAPSGSVRTAAIRRQPSDATAVG